MYVTIFSLFLLVYISNIVYHAYDKNNESIRGTMSKLLEAKIGAVEQLIKSISPNLGEETRSDLAQKILNEIWNVSNYYII